MAYRFNPDNTDIHTDIQTDMQTRVQTDTQTDRNTHIQTFDTDRQRGTQTYIQIGTRSDRHADIQLVCIFLSFHFAFTVLLLCVYCMVIMYFVDFRSAFTL